MNKLLTASALALGASAAKSGDFFQGVQTAIFLRSEEDFADYNCPEPEVDEGVDKYLSMIEPMRMMMGGQKAGKKTKKKSSMESEQQDNNPMLDAMEKANKYGEQIGIIMSVLKADYEGGDYCAGLTATFESKSIAMKLIKGGMSKKKKQPVVTDVSEDDE